MVFVISVTFFLPSKLALTSALFLVAVIQSEAVTFSFLLIFQFEQFYNGRFNGRKLTWLQHLSTGRLKKYERALPHMCLYSGRILISNGTSSIKLKSGKIHSSFLNVSVSWFIRAVSFDILISLEVISFSKIL